MAKYGRTDPAVYQLRDMNRRLTAAERRITKMIERNSIFRQHIADRLRAITAQSAVATADLEEE